MYLFNNVFQLHRLYYVEWKAEIYELKAMCKEATASYFKLMPKNLRGQTDENIGRFSLTQD